jgi:5-methylcytosine-specific restriction protein A
VPSAPLRYCAEPGCPERTATHRCVQHQKAKRDYEQRFQSGGGKYGRPWRRATQQWIAADPDTRAWCTHCKAEGKDVLGEETDHIRPHRGDQALFWDEANWQRLCRRHHSMKTAQEVREGFQPGRYVICGPSGAGKTTWVAARRRPGDIVWDLDVLADAMTQTPTYPRPEHVVSLMRTLEDALIGWLQIHQSAQAFVIHSHAGMAGVIERRLNASLVDLSDVTQRASGPTTGRPFAE